MSRKTKVEESRLRDQRIAELKRDSTEDPSPIVYCLAPRWPGDKVLAEGQERRRFESRFHQRSVVYASLVYIQNVGDICPPASVERIFGEGMPAQLSSSSFDLDSK
ncbi:hypothetical protein AVEN_169911-1 [Araneus ventricosus]|uniref:Uncharacterized protein n=1 Tax=Araneus ventricosus TaxID=182803 RepID=A0A4Y2EZD5_ARAVE|nr:hypothetical protein AVEN_169911-1 [Araneus ventricosus]